MIFQEKYLSPDFFLLLGEKRHASLKGWMTKNQWKSPNLTYFTIFGFFRGRDLIWEIDKKTNWKSESQMNIRTFDAVFIWSTPFFFFKRRKGKFQRKKNYGDKIFSYYELLKGINEALGNYKLYEISETKFW